MRVAFFWVAPQNGDSRVLTIISGPKSPNRILKKLREPSAIPLSIGGSQVVSILRQNSI